MLNNLLKIFSRYKEYCKEKRLKKQKLKLQLSLMSGSIKRIK